jgi:hypothetical protein
VKAGLPAQTTTIDRALWALWAVFWLLMLLVAVEDERGDHGVRWWEPLLWEGSSALVATGWLLLQRRVAPRWHKDLGEPLRWFGRHLAWLPLVVVSFIAAVYALRHGVYALVGDVYEHRPLPQVFLYEGIKLTLFSGLWIGLIFGLESFASWRHERERLLALQKHLAESQLAQLKAQLQPHFLFNALNTISSLMQVDVERADRLLTQLADLLRATLQAGERDLNSLREELELLRLYSRIMEERFAGRVNIAWKVHEDTLDAAIPALLLQPLLENVYKHGVERSATPVAVEVTVERHGDTLAVIVRNHGELRGTGTTGIGLRNCRERLALLHGAHAGLTLEGNGGVVTARLTLPWRPHTP